MSLWRRVSRRSRFSNEMTWRRRFSAPGAQTATATLLIQMSPQEAGFLPSPVQPFRTRCGASSNLSGGLGPSRIH